MQKRVYWVVLIASAAVVSAAAQQSFTGTLSDSSCRASHQPKAGALTDRQCLLMCIKGLAKFVLVDHRQQATPIANQDAMGLPLYAGRPVKLTGESKGDAIFVTKVEAIPAHLHLGHVMTNWRDTPGTRGFLPVAIDEAKVAVLHAALAAKGATLDEVKLHAGHVLHALDPAVEPKGPGAGYGVQKATTGARQHLDLAAQAEGATANIATHAAHVSASLASALQRVNQAIAVIAGIRAATDIAAATRQADELVAVLRRITDEDLQLAHTHMELMLKAEGIFGAPR